MQRLIDSRWALMALSRLPPTGRLSRKGTSQLPRLAEVPNLTSVVDGPWALQDQNLALL